MGRSTVDLVDYSNEWPVRFRHAANALKAVLGDRALVIEHIGSTSVPGLAAKPTIDIAVGLRTLDDLHACRQALEVMGYDFRGGLDPDHLMVRKIVGDERAQHVHFHVYPADEFDDWIAFRDLLRRDAGARRAYEEEKRRLAQRFYDDRGSYVEGKSTIVAQLVARARSDARRHDRRHPGPSRPTAGAPTLGPGVRLHIVPPGEWELWKEVRLRALADSPDSFGATFAEWESAPPARWRERLSEVPFNVVAVAVDDGQAAGQASGTPPDEGGRVHLISMWVDPQCRGAGVADALVAAVTAHAERVGATAVRLSVRRHNERAIAMYRRAGFQLAEESADEPDEIAMLHHLQV